MTIQATTAVGRGSHAPHKAVVGALGLLSLVLRSWLDEDLGNIGLCLGAWGHGVQSAS